MSKLSPEQLTAWTTQAKTLEQGIKALLVEVREALDQHDVAALHTAESDLYDAMECLVDFGDACESLA